MAGAIALAGLAALRSGAGLLSLAVPKACLDTVAGFEPSYMTVPLPADTEGRLSAAARGRLEHLAQTATAIGLGPGMGRSPQIDGLVAGLYTKLDNPLVVDADGLNALASQPDVLSRPGGPRVLTPHPGEFSRLDGVQHVDRNQSGQRAVELAGQCNAVVVLKGHQTLVTDGSQSIKNATGNPGMATGGSGDVLTGVITALIAQGLSPLDAAQLGVHLHGRAGDLAAEQFGPVSLIASDLVKFLPAAFKELGSDRSD